MVFVNAKSKTNTKCYENLNAICHKTIWCLSLRNNMANDTLVLDEMTINYLKQKQKEPEVLMVNIKDLSK